MDKKEKRCGMCAYFWDEWDDGTGKCAASHDGITRSDAGSGCRAYREIDYFTTDDQQIEER